MWFPSPWRNRFDIDKIYTFTGPILIVWNLMGRTEGDGEMFFFGRWKLVVFGESLKKVGEFMVGQPTPPLMYPSRKKALLYTPLCLEGVRQEGVGWLAIMNFSGICWWNPKSFSCFPTQKDFWVGRHIHQLIPHPKTWRVDAVFPPLRNLTKSLGWKKNVIFRSCQATNDTFFELKGRLEGTTGLLRHSPNPHWSCHQLAWFWLFLMGFLHKLVGWDFAFPLF